ncbi:MAG: alpha/beta hydrolase [Rudaea sp.]|nr:alpha/beta hydrolase [Rudaea sp.]
MNGYPVVRVGARLRMVLLAFSVPIIAGCQGLLFGTLGVAGRTQGIEVRRGVIFDPIHKLALDVYRPTGAIDAPVVVFFYGGSWKEGTRAWYRFVGESLAKRGLVVVIPDYRKYPEVRFPAFVEDAANAVRFAHDHAADYGGDAQAFFVMGHSAGAYIGAMLATDARYLDAVGMKPRDLSGFIGLAGPYDFAPITDPAIRPIFGASVEEQQAAQPVNHVGGDEPPMLLLHGRADNTVWPTNSEALARRLRDAGEPVELKFYPGIGHARILLSLSPLLSGWSSALDDSLRFIDACLGVGQRRARSGERARASPHPTLDPEPSKEPVQ